ncbi:retroviral-like aspartic protease family protein [Phormidium sp. LEGE 05292]|uniref:retropepsin-like aspartic protease family protein n=1 Tax=[Phormidium] sp. LEGE 05292 TaxID=767427 RepID=UPI001880F808|nr:retropepsin-like aspartic protease [Phormidium sp. LEGE 05292]MBE9229601.1 retroviral-like aspartic protease family protein [Phormidium sp. LEGE 05292]
MEKVARDHSLLILLSGMIAVVSMACSSDNATQSPNVKVESKVNALVAKPKTVVLEQKQEQVAVGDSYEEAIAKAARAKSIGESAQSRDDWKLVNTQWQKVMQLLKAVPASSPNYANAKAKLKEYQEQADYAAKQADPKIKPVSLASKCTTKVSTSEPSGTVIRVPIKRREFGTLVIDVTLTNTNIKQTFEMMLDTGASGTAITQEMAARLNVETVAVAKVNTAAGGALIGVGCLDAVQVAGASLKNVPVGIPPGLSIGLLGQDFFSRYDMTIKNNFVEFRVR